MWPSQDITERRGNFPGSQARTQAAALLSQALGTLPREKEKGKFLFFFFFFCSLFSIRQVNVSLPAHPPRK